MINKLTEQFDELTKKIETAVMTDDQQVVTALDRQISYVWNQISDFTPSSPKDAYRMIEFLLDHLTEKREIRESEKFAKIKIMTILDDNLDF
ncbi:MAG: hypothetical protein JKX91_13225 [Rhizobiaceae bacterium]|nr:hypothetical protein [Rhizobiaceae bacterium]